jgi:hypothetical protein
MKYYTNSGIISGGSRGRPCGGALPEIYKGNNGNIFLNIKGCSNLTVSASAVSFIQCLPLGIIGNCLGAPGEKGRPADRAFKKNINYINNLLRKSTTTRQQEKVPDGLDIIK